MHVVVLFWFRIEAGQIDPVSLLLNNLLTKMTMTCSIRYVLLLKRANLY